MKFVLIPAGRFEREANPTHTVTISQPFYLDVHTVTQSQWKAVMETMPWKGQANVVEGEDFPAVYVSWEDAQAFVEKISGRDHAYTYRLPTEAEWEYACQAGSEAAYCFGDDASELGAYGWYRANAWDVGKKYAHRVGQKKSNMFGLYDMHGNVWEWVWDWYGDYPSEAVADPEGPETGSYRVFRGGSFFNTARDAESAFRFFDAPGRRIFFLGFRPVREV